MLTEHPEIDFLSFTSYSPAQPDRLAREMIDHRISKEGSLQETTVQGYRGLSAKGKPGGSIFVGKGENNAGQSGGVKFAHYYMKWSGDYSDHLLMYHDKTTKCTRVDLQVTLPERMGERENIGYLIDQIYNRGVRAYVGKGKPAKSSVVQSDTRTLYIGRRSKGTGGRLVRVYEKPGLDGNMYVRVELELRGNEAESFIGLLAEYSWPDATAGVLAEHIGRFNPAFSEFFAPYASACSESEALECKVVRERERDTMTWLESMTESWRKVLMDGETRNRAVSLISRLERMVIDTSTEFDNLE